MIPWGGQAGCLRLQTKHVAKTQLRRVAHDGNLFLFSYSFPSAKTGIERCAVQVGFSKCHCEKVIGQAVVGQLGDLLNTGLCDGSLTCDLLLKAV